MKLSELLSQLSYGELSNTNFGSSGSGSIKTEKIPAVVNFINEALLRIYSKFPLRKKTLYLELNEWRTDYPLTYDHAYSNPDALDKDKYIFDLGNHKFEDDVLKIYEVKTTLEVSLPINNPDEDWSVYTPVYNVLQVRRPVGGTVLFVKYWAKHPKVTEDLNQEIEIPEVLEGALRAYVAFQVYSHMNTQEAVANSQKFQVLYQEIINEALTSDSITVSLNQTGLKFKKNGWV